VRVRYQLRSLQVFRWIMEHPGRGAPYSVRALAEAASAAPSTVGHLVSGRATACDMDTAHALSEALGVAVLVLFAPPASPKSNDSDSDIRHTNLTTHVEEPCEHARAHQPV
jgi:hypothetical protein